MATVGKSVKAARAAFCCACGTAIDSAIWDVGYRDDLGRARTVHARCVTTVLDSTSTARFRQVYDLEPPAARKVAQELGILVTRDKKYIGHAEVSRRAAWCGANDVKWSNVVARATRQFSAATPPPPVAAATSSSGGGATVTVSDGAWPPAATPPTALADGALAEAVAEAVAAAVGDLDARTADVAREVAVQAARDEVSAAARSAAATAAKDATREAVAALDASVREAAAKAARVAVEALAPRELVVKVVAGGAVNVGRAHKQFERLLKMVAAGVNVWLCGPAGSGKTTAAEQVARALGRKFYFNGAVDSEYKLSGFVDAQGRVVSTAFRRAYKTGGVYLFDEVDASLPGAVLAFNAALANGHADFPGDDEPTPRHRDFACVAAANTWGHGATTEYVGRNRMDAAFLDRFAQLTWDYDEELERELAAPSGDVGRAWCLEVQRLRAEVRRRGLKVVVSPRATIYGCRLLAVGMTVDEVRDATVMAKLSQQDRDNLAAAARAVAA